MEEGEYYHIFNRGVNREEIFKEERNYEFFLRRYQYYLRDYLETYAYCLMPNHFHLLVRIKEPEPAKDLRGFRNLVGLKPAGVEKQGLAPLDKAFKNFFTSYAKAINKAYDRTGSLFQNRFKKKLVEDDSYFSSLVAYIHLNPVNARLCKEPEDWPYSSYNSFLGDSNQIVPVEKKEVFDWFGDKEEFINFHKITDQEPQLTKYTFD
ncbi:MAG: transposase [Cyclobacteriaceae bacterium]